MKLLGLGIRAEVREYDRETRYGYKKSTQGILVRVMELFQFLTNRLVDTGTYNCDGIV